MQLRSLAAGLFLSAFGASGDDTEARARLAGTWVSADPAQARETWTLKEESGAFRIALEKDGKIITTSSCKATGEECRFKDGDKDVVVSMWFSGPKLVQLWTSGSSVVKKRFGVAGDGQTLEVEVIPVVPPGKPETAKYSRAADH